MIKNILIPLDFSDVTKKLIEQGIIYAKVFNSSVHLIHIIEPIVITTGYTGMGPMAIDSIKQDQEFDEKELDLQKEKLKRENIVVKTNAIEGVPPEQIIKYAKDNNIDLVILGSHGHGGLYHLFLGSVSQAVVHKATCPIMIIPVEKKK